MRRLGLVVLFVTLVFTSGTAVGQTNAELVAEVQAVENAFAATMAQRDLEAFATFLADEAVFFGGEQPLRGKAAIKAGWSAYYDGEAAPFSWRSATVEVLASGTLAHSSGPVLTPDGQEFATFNSVWRREVNGSWKVVFDKGCTRCP